jgi:hypothetical protein
MRKNAEGFASPHNTNTGEHGSPTIIVRDTPVLNYCEKYVRVHSKKYRERLAISNVLRALLSAGEIVDEKRLETLNPEYRFRGDFLKSMRRIHLSYPTQTQMFLESGIWKICPAIVMQPCIRYECPARLMCGRVQV